MNHAVFRDLQVHRCCVADDFCDFAAELREELLGTLGWRCMPNAALSSEFDWKNGIMTRHLDQDRRDLHPLYFRFKDYLKEHASELARRVGVDLETCEIELNAMAYGQGCWLSPHTDETPGIRQRAIACILYLNDPADGEWSVSDGGALRVYTREGQEARVCPRFNRFAMFRVAKDSYHEIERVTRETTWRTSRLTLAGWVMNVPTPAARGTLEYLRSPDSEKRRARVDARLQGALASYRLLVDQRSHRGLETSEEERELEDLRLDLQAHHQAPPGTSFMGRVTGPSGVIFVREPNAGVVYFGPPSDYSPTASESPSTAPR